MRCAFAHDLMHPKWVVRGEFARSYQLILNGTNRDIDLRLLDGAGLELEQIGGMHVYQAMQDEVVTWLGEIQAEISASAV